MSKRNQINKKQKYNSKKNKTLITPNIIEVYDSKGVLRVRIGSW